jgi:hypothetical protein
MPCCRPDRIARASAAGFAGDTERPVPDELIRRHAAGRALEREFYTEPRFFEPGPYSQQEAYALRFVDWYLKALATP